MENADQELKETEDMLRALAAQDRAKRADDAALAARLCETADAACRRSYLRPWYRSRIFWRSVAALVLLAVIPVLWQWSREQTERSVMADALAGSGTESVLPERVKCEPVCGAGEPTVALVVATDCMPQAESVPMPQAVTISMVDELCEEVSASALTARETAVAVYSGGVETDCDAEEEPRHTPCDALTYHPNIHQSVPALRAKKAARRKAKKAAGVRSVSDKLKMYAEAMLRAAAVKP